MITFHQDCVIYEIGRDGYGKPIKKNEQNLKCRVKEKYQLVKDKSALEKVSELQVTLPKNAYVDVDYKIQIKNDDGTWSKEYSIISFKFTRNTLSEIVKKVVYV